MKRLLTALALLLTMTLSASAMSYSQAREEALFLTDKMAYELNLTDEQYEAAYEINLDYLMRIDDYNDLYGVYWRQRNLDLSYILLDWQYRAYCGASYFYRPLYWSDSGTSVSMRAIRIATTSSSVVLTSCSPTPEAIPGIIMVDAPGTTDVYGTDRVMVDVI